MQDKNEAARNPVKHHFEIEPKLHVAYRILSGNEASPSEPIKLLEVNASTMATGSVEIFAFGPSGELPFAVQIAEITPDELETFQRDPRALPDGWDLKHAEVHLRDAA